MPTIEFPDFRFTGTAEECALFVMALRAAKPTPAPAPAPASTPRLRSSEAWPVPQSVASGAPAQKPPQQLDVDTVGQMAIRLLRHIRDHSNSGGIDGDYVAKILGVSHPKGIAYPASQINKLLVSNGFEVGAVYQNRRDGSGARNWLAGPKLKEALDLLEVFHEGEPETAKN